MANFQLFFTFFCAFFVVRSNFEDLSQRTTWVAKDIITQMAAKDPNLEEYISSNNQVKEHGAGIEYIQTLFHTQNPTKTKDAVEESRNMRLCSSQEYEDFVYDTTMIGLYENTCLKLNIIWDLVDVNWKKDIENIFSNGNITYFGNHNKLETLFNKDFIDILDIINPWYEAGLNDNDKYLAVKDDISMHFILWIIKKKILNLTPHKVCENIETELITSDIRSNVLDCILDEATYAMMNMENELENLGRDKANCSNLKPKFIGLNAAFEISILFYYSQGKGYGASLDGTIHNYKVKRIGGSLLLGAGVYIEIQYMKNVANLYNQTNFMMALDLEYIGLVGASILIPTDSLKGNKLVKGPAGYSLRLGLGYSPFFASLDFAKATQTKIRQGGFNATKYCQQFEKKTKAPTSTRRPTRSPRPTRPPHKAIFPTPAPF